MIVNKENIKYIDVFPGTHRNAPECRRLLESLLIELDEIDLIIRKWFGQSIKVHYCSEYTEYSPERTDPCPDYCGTFTLRWENDSQDIIGVEMSIEELDNAICMLYDLCDKLGKFDF